MTFFNFSFFPDPESYHISNVIISTLSIYSVLYVYCAEFSTSTAGKLKLLKRKTVANAVAMPVAYKAKVKSLFSSLDFRVL